MSKTMVARLAVVAGLVACGVIAWFSFKSPVRLDGDHYEMTVALYRVCNQQDQEGLVRIKAMLDQQPTAADERSAQDEAIESIVSQAEAGAWQDAMATCRLLLEEQVAR